MPIDVYMLLFIWCQHLASKASEVVVVVDFLFSTILIKWNYWKKGHTLCYSLLVSANFQFEVETDIFFPLQETQTRNNYAMSLTRWAAAGDKYKTAMFIYVYVCLFFVVFYCL